LEAAPAAALLLDFALAGGSEGGFLHRLRRRFPRLPIALAAGGEVDQHLDTLRDLNLGVVLPRQAPLEPERLARVWASFAAPEQSARLEYHMPPSAAIQGLSLRSLSDKALVMSQAVEALERSRRASPSVFDVQLVFEEIVNNALVHAFRDSSGRETPRLLDRTPLAENEIVEARFGIHAGGLGLSVRDNQGTLRAATVLDRLYRQASLTGLTDENGRGFYLSRVLSAELHICIRPGRLTEVIALFDSVHPKRPKTLCIYEAAED